jgi:hypothetical protein
MQQEEMHLEYQRLLKQYPNLPERLAALPGRVFSGKQHPSAGARAVFFCYSLPVPPPMNAPDECAHLVAIIDIHSHDYQGGYVYEHHHEFQEAIEACFRPLLRDGGQQEDRWSDSDVIELWNEAVESYLPHDEYVSLDRDIMTRLVINLLKKAGAVEHVGSDDPGVPGFSSSVSVLHALSPEKAFKAAVALLKERLAS